MNIAEILKNAPKGTKLWSTMYGEVSLIMVREDATQHILVELPDGNETWYSKEGKYNDYCQDECILYPSEGNRDWSTFKVNKPYKVGDYLLKKDTNRVYKIISKVNGDYDLQSVATDNFYHFGYKKESSLNEEYKICDKFQLSYLKPFDRVLVRDSEDGFWKCTLFSYTHNNKTPVCEGGITWRMCVPYNDDTKHLVGTTDEAPEFYNNFKSYQSWINIQSK